MSRRIRDLTAEELRLWSRVASGVNKSSRKHEPAAQRLPAPEQSTRLATHTKSPSPAKLRHTPPAERGAEKRVRRGKVEVGAILDLHGYTQATARPALERFLAGAQARGHKAVVVVTGVGRAGEGVLKRRLPEWLNERGLRELASGYAPAHRIHGGEGAFYVFIRRSRPAPTATNS